MMKLQNKLMLLGLSAAIVGGIAYSQISIHEKNRKEIREIAREIAFDYKEKLDLTEKQAMRLEKIIIQSTIRKNDVLKSNVDEIKKIQKLQQIQLKEHQNLKKVLDEKEFLAYVGFNLKNPAGITSSF